MNYLKANPYDKSMDDNNFLDFLEAHSRCCYSMEYRCWKQWSPEIILLLGCLAHSLRLDVNHFDNMLGG